MADVAQVQTALLPDLMHVWACEHEVAARAGELEAVPTQGLGIRVGSDFDAQEKQMWSDRGPTS